MATETPPQPTFPNPTSRAPANRWPCPPQFRIAAPGFGRQNGCIMATANQHIFGIPRRLVARLAGLAVVLSFGAIARPAAGQTALTITTTNYHGWSNAVVLANGTAEVVVVPAIGRIMQFRFLTNAGAFWENPKLVGQGRLVDRSQWSNFGGDKSWPAPQDDWPRRIGRGWPPPAAFDSADYTATPLPDGVQLVSPVDAHYGIRVRREIRLAPQKPELTINTTFEKASGSNMNVAVWTITQLADPVAVFAPAPTNGLPGITGTRPPSLLFDENHLINLRRDPENSYKIGLRGEQLLWVGKETAVLLSVHRVAGAKYPDQDTSTQIYTNPDAAPYVECELLGPLSEMKVGDQKSLQTILTLFPRTELLPGDDARKILRP